MLFSSITFLYYFLPITLLIYFIMPAKGRNVVLLAASLFFYFWGEPRLGWIMLCAIFIGYLAGILLGKIQDRKVKKLLLALSLVLVVFLLFYFKYLDFAIGLVNGITGSNIPLMKLVLPIGISFYLFQIISYLIDVYRGEVKAEYNLIHFAMYVSLFPQLIAGPIVRYESIADKVKNREITFDAVWYGTGRFIIGLSKKVLLADSFGKLASELNSLVGLPFWGYWMVAIVYTFQIYFDFSGYSDMAIGLGSILGFHFPENFRYPYISQSITEFWRRWHITLGGWFRDYVYIPLGGNRVGKLRFICNVMIVWSLSGLWHGASMNFVIWGVYYGVLLLLEKLFLYKWLEKLPKLVRVGYTMLLVILGFAVFQTNDWTGAMKQLGGMFGLLGTEKSEAVGLCLYYIRSYWFLGILGIIGATPLPAVIWNKTKWLSKVRKYGAPVFYLFCIILVTAYLVNGSFQAFLYFRF